MAGAFAAPAMAQDAQATGTTAAPADSTEVVVVGVRRSLKTSQQIKRDADTIVDSITSTDIGAFPDKSVAEALQRVAGITVSRFAATTDTAHFSAEPTGVIVRGLSQVRSEFNGRDTFSANSSRGLSWGDVSPELMSGVDSYKNETASMIEGGIAGTINLRTRLPFDQKGRLLALSADVAYNDLSKATTPDVSAIYSNRWDTDGGEFGFLINGAYSSVKTRSQGEQLSRDGVFGPGVFDSGYTYLPTRATDRDNVYDRKRHGIAAAAQWQNHDHTLLATLQYNDSTYDQTFNEKFVGAQFFGTWQQSVSTVFDNAFPERVLPAPGSGGFTFDDQGIFQSGTMTGPFVNSTGDAIGRDGQGATLIHQCAYWNGDLPGQEATQATCGRLATPLNTGTRFQDNKESTQDTSFNLKWDVSDKLHLGFDVQYVNSTVTNYDMEAALQTWADVALNMKGPDGHPTMAFSSPDNIHFTDGGKLDNAGDYHIDYLMDHIEDSKGHELATKFDLEYDLGDGWLNSLQAGVRYSDREQTIQWSTYNWSSISDGVWSNASTAPVVDSNGVVLTAGSGGNNNYHQLDTNYPITSTVYPQNAFDVYSFGSELMGSKGLLSSNQFVFLNPALVANQKALAAAFGAPSLGWTDPNSPTGYEGWVPVCERITNLPNSCFTPSEYNKVSEKTLAGYLELKFGGADKTIFNGVTVSGNAGVRWVQTEDDVEGYIQFPNGGAVSACDLTSAGHAPPERQTGCLFQDGATNIRNAVAFGDNGYAPNNSDKDHINWLPSFNLKLGLNDQWILRFAASRAMSRPDMGYLRSYVTIGAPTWDPNCNSTSNCVQTAGVTTDLVPQFTATSGNPLLKPMTADQFDLSVEDYFASVGSFTFDIFYKKFHNYIQLGQQHIQYTNNGVTEDAIVQMPLNQDGASVRGFEVAYQRFFDFLPGFWSGFGVQANYTHLNNTGVNNSTLNSTNAGTPIPQNSSNGSSSYDSINPHSLEGLSDDSYNIIGMYEKGPWAARLAYNWRSKYLLSALDCCVGLPIWNDAEGQLDGSLRYKVNDNIEVSLEGSNLLNTETVLEQQVSGDFGNGNVRPTVLAPDAWFRNDRRVQVGIRLKY
ncbi:MAG: TonB-dependent receptor [Asticcacaulis sp.]